MDRKGWTRKQLAESLGTSASYLTQLFRGDRLLNFKTEAKIEAALGIKFVIKQHQPGKSDNDPGSFVNYKDDEGLQL